MLNDQAFHVIHGVVGEVKVEGYGGAYIFLDVRSMEIKAFLKGVFGFTYVLGVVTEFTVQEIDDVCALTGGVLANGECFSGLMTVESGALYRMFFTDNAFLRAFMEAWDTVRDLSREG